MHCDGTTFDIVEDPELVNSQPKLRSGYPSEPLDAAAAHLFRLMTQVHFHRVSYRGSHRCLQRLEIGHGLVGKSDGKPHSG